MATGVVNAEGDARRFTMWDASPLAGGPSAVSHVGCGSPSPPPRPPTIASAEFRGSRTFGEPRVANDVAGGSGSASSSVPRLAALHAAVRQRSASRRQTTESLDQRQRASLGRRTALSHEQSTAKRRTRAALSELRAMGLLHWRVAHHDAVLGARGDEEFHVSASDDDGEFTLDDRPLPLAGAAARRHNNPTSSRDLEVEDVEDEQGGGGFTCLLRQEDAVMLAAWLDDLAASRSVGPGAATNGPASSLDFTSVASRLRNVTDKWRTEAATPPPTLYSPPRIDGEMAELDAIAQAALVRGYVDLRDRATREEHHARDEVLRLRHNVLRECAVDLEAAIEAAASQIRACRDEMSALCVVAPPPGGERGLAPPDGQGMVAGELKLLKLDETAHRDDVERSERVAYLRWFTSECTSRARLHRLSAAAEGQRGSQRLATVRRKVEELTALLESLRTRVDESRDAMVYYHQGGGVLSSSSASSTTTASSVAFTPAPGRREESHDDTEDGQEGGEDALLRKQRHLEVEVAAARETVLALRCELLGRPAPEATGISSLQQQAVALASELARTRQQLVELEQQLFTTAATTHRRGVASSAAGEQRVRVAQLYHDLKARIEEAVLEEQRLVAAVDLRAASVSRADSIAEQREAVSREEDQLQREIAGIRTALSVEEAKLQRLRAVAEEDFRDFVQFSSH